MLNSDSHFQRDPASTERERQLALYKSWLISHGYSPRTAEVYTRIIERSHEDPVKWMRAQGSLQSFRKGRGAWKSMSQYLGNDEIYDSIRKIAPPKAAPRRIRVLPTPLEWVELAQRVWNLPGALGAAGHVLLWSSLRISDVARITRMSILEVVEKGSTITVQKGKGGDAKRRFTPGPLARLGIDRLAKEQGYTQVWELLGKTQDAAVQRLRSIVAPFHPHDFRAAFITYAVRRRMPLPTLQAITGHASLSALEKYIQLSVAVPEEAVYEAQADMTNWLIGLAKLAKEKEPK